MKISELRIGNIVQYNNCLCVVASILSPKPLKDKRFSNKCIIELYVNGLINVTIDQISPVQLNEEWLIELGFRKNTINLRLFRIGNISLYLDEDNEGNIHKENAYLCTVKHVHHIQNLYFNLTDTELPPSGNEMDFTTKKPGIPPVDE